MRWKPGESRGGGGYGLIEGGGVIFCGCNARFTRCAVRAPDEAAPFQSLTLQMS